VLSACLSCVLRLITVLDGFGSSGSLDDSDEVAFRPPLSEALEWLRHLLLDAVALLEDFVLLLNSLVTVTRLSEGLVDSVNLERTGEPSDGLG